jgi:hypothetical protein
MVNVKLGEAIVGKENVWVTQIIPTNYNVETLKRTLFKKAVGIKFKDEFTDNLNEYDLRIKFTFDSPILGDEVEFDLSNAQILIGVDDCDEKFILVIPRSYQFDMELHQYLERKRQKKIGKFNSTDVFIVGPRI